MSTINMPKHIIARYQAYARTERDDPGTHSYNVCAICGVPTWTGTDTTKNGLPKLDFDTAHRCDHCREFERRFPDVANKMAEMMRYILILLEAR